MISVQPAIPACFTCFVTAAGLIQVLSPLYFFSIAKPHVVSELLIAFSPAFVTQQNNIACWCWLTQLISSLTAHSVLLGAHNVKIAVGYPTWNKPYSSPTDTHYGHVCWGSTATCPSIVLNAFRSSWQQMLPSAL